MSQSRDSVSVSANYSHLGIVHPLETLEITQRLLSFLISNPQSIIQLGMTSRFFNQQTKGCLLNNPDYVMKGIRALEKEIRIAIKTVLPALNKKSPCRIYHVLLDLPQDIQSHDIWIQSVKKLAARNQLTLNLLKYGRDSAFIGGKVCPAVGILLYIMGFASLGLEFVLLGIMIAAVIYYLDKYVVNNGMQRANSIPTREDMLHTPSVDALLKRYAELEKFCDAWLKLDGRMKEEYCDKPQILLLTEEDKIENRLFLEMKRDQ